VLEARSSSKAVDLTVGDRVIYEKQDSDYVALEILPRRNQLERKNEVRSRIFAANIDHLYIITAVGSLFSTTFIDRALVVAAEQQINTTLVINKVDVQEVSASTPWAIYRNIGISIIETSVKSGQGIEELIKSVLTPDNNWIVLCGFSGVGKSSILNQLIPGSRRKTGDLSESGQGKQTTSQAEAFLLERPGALPLQLVDLPGFSQFGLAHISKQHLSSYFPEFTEPARHCDFLDCSHREEPICGVKEALKQGLIEISRYQSYREIHHEIECAHRY
jgi:ribosome biogenesis GTPase